MMRSLALLLSFLQVAVHATQYLDHNLAYRSPFFGDAKLSHDTRSIQRRGVVHVRRQMGSAAGFTDDHYPTFYGGDFSNSPFIWSGGLNFTHSVASGDPLDTSVLLWTRAVPMSAGGLAMPDQSVPACLAYKVFSDQGTDGSPVASGQAFTSYDVDWTVKVEAKGLQPDTTYVYRFSDCANPNSVSPTGSTRTLPSPDTPADQVNGGNPLTLAVFSCSQYQSGYFNAYGVAARNTSADIYIHLGDYV
ncbi:hypothetical protein VNI00_008219 [Paramarasmius palmivorus]|uniref:Uncharacterized protein n=1 Tax=Paramarasmius palmivorus TaxID=297713 RepID=A0AAW0CWX3_9AGAR